MVSVGKYTNLMDPISMGHSSFSESCFLSYVYILDNKN